MKRSALNVCHSKLPSIIILLNDLGSDSVPFNYKLSVRQSLQVIDPDEEKLVVGSQKSDCHVKLL